MTKRITNKTKQNPTAPAPAANAIEGQRPK